MIVRKTVTVVLCVIFGCALAVAAATDEEAKALFEKKCGICHATKRTTDKTNTREGWKSTVLRMKNTNGCPINDNEAETIIDYLFKNYGKK